MTYQDIMEQARGTMGAYCKVCPVCNGRACEKSASGAWGKRCRWIHHFPCLEKHFGIRFLQDRSVR